MESFVFPMYQPTKDGFISLNSKGEVPAISLNILPAATRSQSK
jgi:hypothetical protein